MITISISAAILVLGAVQSPGRITLLLEQQFGSREDFTAIGAASIRADGTVAIADRGDLRIHLFDSHGRWISAVGGRGDGPGEFRTIGRIGWTHDTLWVTDPQLGRVSRFFADGTLIASKLFRGPRLGAGMRIDTPDGFLKDGTAVGIPTVPMASMASGVATSLPVIATTDSQLSAVLAYRPRSRIIWRIELKDKGLSTLQPFGQTDDWDIFPDGRGIAFADGRVTDDGVGSIRVVSTNGTKDSAFTSEIPYLAKRPSAEVIDSAIRDLISMWTKYHGSPAGLENAARSTLYVPKFLPPVTRVLAGIDGSVWLQRESRRDWIVLDSTGRLVSTLGLDPRIHLFIVSLHSVLASITDSDGVQTAARFRVATAPSAR